ncbi:MAG: methyltransferase domain-containing protein [Candidatus Omnitrophica bacterium]|nr:methyltransferase domain-containing protein [Candidatus Omnitrophota bacterium]MDD5429312.1 methyltransferase domain-containing protein [Candidatus Omnitrophota bacterium]
MLKQLLEKEDIQRFYKDSGKSISQEFLCQGNVKDWKWSFDFTSCIRQIVIDSLIEKLNLNNCRAIELGCAGGYFLKTLISYGNIAYGIDLDRNCLQRIAKNKNLYLCQADVEKIPFGSNSFDAALFLEVLEHLPSPYSVIVEVGRILKPGGILVLTTPNLNCIPASYFLNPLKLFVQFLATWSNELCLPKPLINSWRKQRFFHTAFSRNEIKNLLKNDFKVKKWTTYGMGGGLVGMLLRLSPSVRKLFKQLNDMEQKSGQGKDYAQLRKKLIHIESKCGKWLGRMNIFLQKIPLIRLMGTNHIIVLEKK